MKKLLKGISIIISIFISIFIALFIYLFIVSSLDPPQIQNKKVLNLNVENPSNSFYSLGTNKLRKSESGLWELYVEGKPFERGVIIGKLTSELIYKQEKAFVNQISRLIPSREYLSFLKYFIGWFNRDIDKYIDKEYKEEIYGISLYASKEFNYISDNYQRILNYHAAHDIGHALQGLSIVGCTSFSVWGEKSKDSSLLVGRNFDFYVGDEFAKEKIVCFFNPSKGYKFAMISWGGMIGTVSGMNIKGLTVTLNAAKSDPPLKAKTPISIVAREILQYASNIQEAYSIAKKRETFVSEAIMVSSAEDNKTVIIEKTPIKTSIFASRKNYIICSNHFQSEKFKNDASNNDNIKNSSSMYRYKRVNELINEYGIFHYGKVALLLRNTNGLVNENIGMGNEKSINQLIAHHSIIFKPQQKIFWVSTAPYQLGKFVAYNLDSVFANFPKIKLNQEIYSKELTIPPDSFLFSKNYKNFLKYKKLKDLVGYDSFKQIKNYDLRIIESNPENYYSYVLSAEFCELNKKYLKALNYYNFALNKVVATNYERNEIIKKIKNVKTKLGFNL